MSTAAEVTEEKVLETLRTVRFPGLSRDIVSFGFVKDLAVGGGNVSFRLEITTESPRAAEQIQRDATEKLRAMPGIQRGHDPAGPAGARAGAAPRRRRGPSAFRPDPSGRPLQSRGGLRQGRRRQVHRRRQPRPRAAAARPARRPDGLRHLRAVAADDDGHRGKAPRQRVQPDRSDRAVWRAGHVSRIPHGRGPAGHLARADGHEGRRAVPAGRGVGQARLTSSSTSRRARATPSSRSRRRSTSPERSS